MDNPYQSPLEACSPFGQSTSAGWARHVRVVAILMIVQGALELLAGIFLAVMACIMPMIVSSANNANRPPEDFVWVVVAMYGGFAAVAFLVAGLHIAAGVRNLRFHGRTLGIVALSCGLLSIFTCYCLPTAVLLAIYGLIVYLDKGTKEAFRLGESGCSSDQVLASFG
jgi:hypothetical protein